MGLIPGEGRSFGGGHGNALQHSCLENPMDRGAWWDAIHEVAESQTRLSTHTHRCFLKEGWTWRGDRERQIPCDVIYMWNLKNITD